MGRYEQFQAYRTKMNNRILGDDAQRLASGGKRAGNKPALGGTLNTKRFFTLDGKTYEPGALNVQTKELLGLVASAVLRCDDCIAYHIDQCVKAGLSDEQIWEALDVALIVGGSIVIPHLRRGVEFLDEARAAMPDAPASTASSSAKAVGARTSESKRRSPGKRPTA